MLFITGTDTGVGKTYFTASLIKALKKRGINAAGFKPIETGCSPKCSDAETLGRASGVYFEPVYSLKRPLAPSVAAEIEGVEIKVDRIKEKIVELSKRYFLVVEGAGGLMVPITWNYSYLSLVKELSLPVIVVALNKLGVINHALLTVKVCESEGVKVLGVVLNSFKEEDESFSTNLSSLKRLLKVPVIPFFSETDGEKALALLS
ncbi:dethiobiotin synthase [Thermovibrio sp.]